MLETEPERAREHDREHAVNELLGDLRRWVRLPLHVTPLDALTAVMCTFSQHASSREARHVWAALPKALSPLLERCMIHRQDELSAFDRAELLRRVADHLCVSLGDAEDITSAVLIVVSSRLPWRAAADVASQLPRELRGLWVVPRRVTPPLEPHPILGEIERSVALPRGVTAAGAFASVMCSLTLHLPLGEARQLVSRLPLDLRPLVELCLVHRGELAAHSDRAGFLARVSRQLDTQRAEPIVRGVFRSVQEYLRSDVVEDVGGQLPGALQEIWLAT